MAAVLGNYNVPLFANEALIWLKNSLGMGNRVHRGFEEERATHKRGDVINIRRPGTFTVNDAPATAEDFSTESVQVALDQHKEVKGKLTDKSLAYTSDAIVTEHIQPMAYALANKIDQDGHALYKFVPNFFDIAGGASTTAVVADILGAQKVLFDAKVPLENEAMLHFTLDGGAKSALAGLAAFSQWQGSGQSGVDTQRTSQLGVRYGFNFFASQNVASHTKGTSSDTALLIDNAAGYAAGSTTINLDAADAAVTGTLVPGDVLTIAGKNYVVTNTVTAAANDLVGVTIYPGLAAAVADDAVVTARLDNHVAMMAFHRDAFTLAMAPLPDFRNSQLFGSSQLGANIATVQDPDTGLSLRLRLYYVGNSSEVHMAMDALYGWKSLNPYLAVRVCG